MSLLFGIGGPVALIIAGGVMQNRLLAMGGLVWLGIQVLYWVLPLGSIVG